jgi:hypothetical protein
MNFNRTAQLCNPRGTAVTTGNPVFIIPLFSAFIKALTGAMTLDVSGKFQAV